MSSLGKPFEPDTTKVSIHFNTTWISDCTPTITNDLTTVTEILEDSPSIPSNHIANLLTKKLNRTLLPFTEEAQ